MRLRSPFGSRARTRAEREAAARLAAAEAAEEDLLFDPGLVTERAATLFLALQAAWSRNDVAELQRLVGPELMVESVTGIYRLRWVLRAGDDPGATNEPFVEAISNEFRLVER